MASDETPNPLAGLPPPPRISLQTIAVTGILCDVYGLDELPPAATGLAHVSVLWLHNPRLGDKQRMAPMAKRAVGAYNDMKPSGSTRGLIAVAFDQRNHGTREVHPLANLAWNKHNPHHAQDMFGIVSGTVLDTSLLIAALPGYLFLDASPPPPAFDQHLVLGVSLGGHSAWQTLFTNPAVTAGVSIIGCPDFAALMRDRARMSKRPTYDRESKGAGFWGSRDFPPALVAQCSKWDPRGIVFGTGDVVEEPEGAERERVRNVLDGCVKGKRFLMCTGGDDKLVPWRCSEAFTRFFVNAADGWYKNAGLSVDNRIYAGKGHECSDGMVVDAVSFVCEEVIGAQTDSVGAKI